ncbi:unnamed protein product [Prorocentrum cordatum]|uniref:Uncharacterized protein n=1 Tax=Prorocentrum cordatum TaxID=2364126 RepID=A0ABN9TLK3_9DINO|nr:unnamed protein product [Polarella glacialis]
MAPRKRAPRGDGPAGEGPVPKKAARSGGHGRGRGGKAREAADAGGADQDIGGLFHLPGGSAPPTIGEVRNPGLGDALRKPGTPCTCQRCKAKSAPETVPLSVNARDQCYSPMPHFHALGVSFAQVCGQCSADKEFGETFEKLIKVADTDPDERSFPTQSILAHKRLGYTVTANFTAKKESDMMSTDTKGLDLEALGENTGAIPSPFTVGQMNDMAITKDDSGPSLQVKMRCKVELEDQIVNVSPQKRVAANQPATMFDKVRKLLTESLPASLRGNKFPPTLEFLKRKALGMIAPGDDGVGAKGSGQSRGDQYGVSAEPPAGNRGLLEANAASGHGAAPPAATGARAPDAGADSVHPDDAAAEAPPLLGTHAGSPELLRQAPGGAMSGGSMTELHQSPCDTKSAVSDGAATTAGGNARYKRNLTDQEKAIDLVNRLDAGQDSAKVDSCISNVRRARLKQEQACKIANPGSVEKGVLFKTLAYAVKLVQLRVKSASVTEDIADAIMPFSIDGSEDFAGDLDGDGGGSNFDCLNPRLREIPALEPAAFVARFRAVASEYVAMPLVKQGQSGRHLNARLVDDMEHILEDATVDKYTGTPQDYDIIKSCARELITILCLLGSLDAPGVDKLVNLDSLIVKKLLDGSLGKCWQTAKQDIEGSRLWAPALALFMRHRADEFDLAPKVVHLMKTLDDIPSWDEQEFFKGNATEVTRNAKLCRPTDCDVAWAKLLDTINTRLRTQTAVGELEVKEMGGIDRFIEELCNSTSFEECSGLKDRIDVLRSIPLAKYEDMTQVDGSRQSVLTLRMFASAPTVGNKNALKNAIYQRQLYFTDADHIEAVRQAMVSVNTAAMASISKHSEQVSVSPEWAMDIKLHKEQLTLMSTRVKTFVADEGWPDTYNTVLADLLSDKLNTIAMAIDLLAEGETAEQQVVSDNGFDAFQALHAVYLESGRERWKEKLTLDGSASWSDVGVQTKYAEFFLMGSTPADLFATIGKMLEDFKRAGMAEVTAQLGKMADSVDAQKGSGEAANVQ